MLREFPNLFGESRVRIQVGNDAEPLRERARMFKGESENRKKEHREQAPGRDDAGPSLTRPKKEQAESEQRTQEPPDRVGVGEQGQGRGERDYVRQSPFVFAGRAVQTEKEQGTRERIERHFNRDAAQLEQPRRYQNRNSGEQRDVSRPPTRQASDPSVAAASRIALALRSRRDQNARAGQAKKGRENVNVNRILVIAECSEIERPADAVLIGPGPSDRLRIVGDRRFVDVKPRRICRDPDKNQGRGDDRDSGQDRGPAAGVLDSGLHEPNP